MEKVIKNSYSNSLSLLIMSIISICCFMGLNKVNAEELEETTEIQYVNKQEIQEDGSFNIETTNNISNTNMYARQASISNPYLYTSYDNSAESANWWVDFKDDAAPYATTRLYFNVARHNEGKLTQGVLNIRSGSGGALQRAFCFDPFVSINVPTNNTPYPNVSIEAIKNRKDFLDKLELITYFGWQSASKSSYNYFTTQLIIWDVMIESGYASTAPNGAGRDTNGKISAVNMSNGTSNYAQRKKEILDLVAKTQKGVSLDSSLPVPLVVGETKKVTDKNGEFSKYSLISNTSNVSVTKSGNSIDLNPTQASNKSGTITYQRFKDSEISTTYLYGSQKGRGDTQEIGVVGLNNPRKLNISVNVTKTSKLKISKKDKDTGKLISGTVFEITIDNDVKTYTTDKNGEISIDVPIGSTYKVKEKTASYGYILNTEEKTGNITKNDITLEYTNVSAKGKIILQKTGKINGTTPVGKYSLTGAVFNIKNSSGEVVDTITTNEKGEAVSKELIYGEYTLEEITAPYGYLKAPNKLVSVTSENPTTTTVNIPVTVEDSEQLGKATIIKKDIDTGELLEGVQFKLINLDTNEVVKNNTLDYFTTDNNGKIEVTNLTLGKYRFEEQKVKEGYVATNPVVRDFEVVYDNSNDDAIPIVINVTNEKIKSNIKLIKTADYDWKTGNKNVFLSGVEYTLYKKGTTEKVASAETDSKGELLFIDVINGEYTLEETKVPEGYEKDSIFDITVTGIEKEMTLSRENKVKNYNFSVSKEDSESNLPILQAGATFKLKNILTNTYYEESGKAEFITDNTGKIVFKEAFPYGKYQLEEIKAPIGYILDSENVQILDTKDLTENSYVFHKANVSKKGELTVKKTTDKAINFDSGKFEYTKVGLNGATFDLVAKEDIKSGDGRVLYPSGVVVATTTTSTINGEEGLGIIKNIPLGSYQLIEKATPVGYILDTTPKDIIISDDGKNNVISMTNTVHNGKAEVKPYLKKISLRQKEIKDTVFEIRLNQELILEEKTVPKDTVVGTMTTNKNGVGTTSINVPNGTKLYAIEVNATTGYYNDKKLYAFVYEAKTNTNGEDLPISSADIVNADQTFRIKGMKQGESFTNINQEQKLGQTITKLTKEATNLSGAEFKIYTVNDIKWADNTLAYAKNSLVDTVVTDNAGEFLSKELPLGEYRIEETITPSGYIKPKEDIYLTGTYAEQTIAIKEQPQEIENKLQQVKISGTKISDTTKGMKGVVFGLYNKEDISLGTKTISKDTLLDISETDEKGLYSFTNYLPEGNYYVKEIKTLDGFLVDTKEISVTYTKETNTDIQEIKLNDVQNTPKKVKLNVTKLGESIISVKKETKEPYGILNTFENKGVENLSGAVFELYAKEDIYTADNSLRYKKNEKIETLVTNESGVIETTKPLYQGNYYLTEIDSPKGFTILKNNVEFTLNYSKNEEEYNIVSKEIKNELQKVSIKGTKVSDTTKLMKGVVFGLYNKNPIQLGADILDKDSLIGISETNDDGEYEFRGYLPEGDYYIKELATLDGFVLNEVPIEFNYTRGNHDSVHTILIDSMKNNPQKIQLNLHKLGESVQKATEYEDKTYGKMYKWDVLGEENLAGVTFDLYSKQDIYTSDNTLRYKADEKIETLVTDEKGEIKTTKDLYKGDYYLKEVSSPNGFTMIEEPIEFSLDYSDNQVENTIKDLEIKNTLQKFVVKVNKEDEKITEWKEGSGKISTEKSNNKVFGLFVTNEVAGVPKDGLISVATTKDGIAEFETLKLPEASFYIKELNAGDYHILSENIYNFESLRYTNEKEVKVNIYSDLVSFDTDTTILDKITGTKEVTYEKKPEKENTVGKPIVNKVIYSDIKIKKYKEQLVKVEESGNKTNYDLTGSDVKFALLNDKKELLTTVTTDKKGEAEFKNIPKGIYYIRELDTGDKKYKLNETVYKLEVTSEGYKITTDKEELKDQTLEVKNDLKKGKVKIRKVDSTNKKEIAGAKLEIKDSNKKVVVSFISKTSPTEFELEDGKYTLTETLAPNGYNLKKESEPFEVKEGKVTKIDFENEPESVKTGSNLLNNSTMVVLGVLIIGVATAMYYKLKKK